MSALTSYRVSCPLRVSKEDAFAYHERDGALQRLTPPWESVAIEQSDGSLKAGSRVVLKTSIFGVPLRWVAEHTAYDPPHLFADTQVSGPFTQWDHRHEFADSDDTTGNLSNLTDAIDYRVPLGTMGRLFGAGLVRKKIESMFAYRHRITQDDLVLMSQYSGSPLHIAISGSHGLVGSSLKCMLTLFGHKTSRIVRDTPSEESVAVWESEAEAERLSGVDAVVHLAGKPIAGKRWTDDVKRQIRDSRVVKTRQLCESLAKLENKPKVLICASATGFYGDRGDEVLDEQSSHGDDFLTDVADQWEQACQPARDAGIRVVHSRFGLILSPQGGSLQKMLLPAKFAGGSLGDGKQWWSWIALDDAVGALYHCIMNEAIRGPVNFVSPHPIRNSDFAKTLGRVISRPAIVPAPAVALRLALGEMADALLLSSARVVPNVLRETNYAFRFTDLEETLRYLLGKDRLKSSLPQRAP